MSKSVLSLLIIGIVVVLVFAIFKKNNRSGKGNVLSKNNFIREFESILQEKHKGAKITYTQTTDEFTVSQQGEENDITYFLGNVYNAVKHRTKEERQEYYNDYLRMNDDSNADMNFSDMINIRIRTPEDLSILQQYAHLHTDDAKIENSRTLINHNGLTLELIEDSPSSIRNITKEQLEEHGLSLKEAFEQAKLNLQDTIGDNNWHKMADSIWISHNEDDFDFARLVTFFPEIEMPFKSTPKAYAPSHAICLITDKSDPETLQKMVQIGDELSVEHRTLSKRLWHFNDGKWTEFLPSTSHPAYAFAKRQSIIEEINNYDEQKTVIERILEQKEQDIFVASLNAYSDDDGNLFTSAVVTIDVQTYLPKADMISLVELKGEDEDADINSMNWEAFVKAMGAENLKTLPDLSPIRYDLTKPLTEEQIKALKSAPDFTPDP